MPPRSKDEDEPDVKATRLHRPINRARYQSWHPDRNLVNLDAALRAADKRAAEQRAAEPEEPKRGPLRPPLRQS